MRTLKRSSTKIDEIFGQFGKQWAETDYEVLLRKDSQVGHRGYFRGRRRWIGWMCLRVSLWED